jgi:hypothetical protein
LVVLSFIKIIYDGISPINTIILIIIKNGSLFIKNRRNKNSTIKVLTTIEKP